MSRITITFTISLPPAMAEEVEAIQKKEYRTRSELIREALRWYIASADRRSLTD
jgi:metal-responsive CopG/Arc/MetJ family transcriptional regulator